MLPCLYALLLQLFIDNVRVHSRAMHDRQSLALFRRLDRDALALCLSNSEPDVTV